MKLFKWFWLALLCLLPGFINSIHAQSLPMDPSVTIGKLTNGFTYYVQKNNNQKKRVTLYLVNKVGSILETDEQRGLAHFMEHMSFNGTTHFPGATLVDFLEKAGVRFGADLNAYTSFDETVYQLPLPIDRPEMLSSGLQVMRDWAAEATLDPGEIDKERGVVLEEKRLRKGAGQRIQEMTFPLMVNHSRYAERDPIGTEEVLKNFKREAILSFYKDWYRPDLQALIVVGDIEVDDVVKRIQTLFSDLKNPADPRPRPDYDIKLTGKNQFLTITDREVQGIQMQVMIKFAGKKLITNSDYLDYLKRNLFNQALARRLQSVSQKNAGNYLGVNAGLTTLVANLDAFSASISARPGELEKGFNAFWAEISKIRTEGFSNEELENAKVQYLSYVKASAAEVDKKQSVQFAQEYVRNFLNGEACPGAAKEAELAASFLPLISVGHLTEIAQQYITPTNRDVIIVAPENVKAGLPDEQTVNSWFAKFDVVTDPVSSKGATQKVSALLQKPLMARMPPKGNILSSVKIEELGVTELKLSNGIKVILKPTTFKNDEISFYAFSPGGTSLFPDQQFQSARYAVSLITAGGLGNFNLEALREKLNGRRVSVEPYIGERSEGVSGYSNVKDIETALQLTYLYFTKPRKDRAAFEATITRAKAALTDPVETPEQVFADTLSAVLSHYNLRRRQVKLADIAEINLNQAFRIYKDRFSDASDFTFVVVGNFDLKSISPLIEQYLGALPSSGRKENPKDLGLDIPAGKITKTVYSGSEDKATVQLMISGEYEYKGDNNARLQGIEHVLQLRMLDRLREQEGGAYSPRVSLQLTHSPKQTFVFTFQFGCSPENADKLIAAVWDEITKLKATGPTSSELAKFKAESGVGIKNALETNNFWMDYLSNQYQEQLDPKAILSYETTVNALTLDELKVAINTYLSDKNYIRAVLMPAKK